MLIKSLGMDIERKDHGKYEMSMQLSDSWVLKREIDDDSLQKLIESINDVRGVNSVMNLFSCTEEQAVKLLRDWGELGNRLGNRECLNCEFKRKECFKCQFICQSPLERTMHLEFRRRGLNPILQRRIRKDGTMYDYPQEVEKETILTIPDFFLEGSKSKLCIYADGKTYHYNNENQGIRDRSIDIALQNLGYKVLRFTGSQIRDDVRKIVDDIINSLN